MLSKTARNKEDIPVGIGLLGHPGIPGPQKYVKLFLFLLWFYLLLGCSRNFVLHGVPRWPSFMIGPKLGLHMPHGLTILSLASRELRR